jgi:hypothetical protein
MPLTQPLDGNNRNAASTAATVSGGGSYGPGTLRPSAANTPGDFPGGAYLVAAWWDHRRGTGPLRPEPGGAIGEESQHGVRVGGQRLLLGDLAPVGE